jgi:ABC-2 type transport system permease protein
MVNIENVDRDTGRRSLEKGGASAMLIIPPGFTSAFLGGPQAKLQLVRNPAQRILPNIIEETLSMAVDGAFYATAGHALPGEPLIRLDSQVIAEKTEQPGGFAAMLLPGTLFLAVFFVAGALAADVWRERTSGVLRRIATTPATLGAFLGGKLLACAVVLGAVGAFGLILGRILVNLHVSSFPLAILWISASGCGLYLLVLMLQSAAGSERMANMLTNFVLLPLTMLGGGFVPFDWMPRGLARLGHFTPNGWSVVQLQAILAGPAEPWRFGALAVFLAAAWFGSARVIRSKMC